MKTTRGLLGRWLIAICGVALLLTATGCAVFIEAFGKSRPDDLPAGSTRQEIRKLLGKPKTSETRDGGVRVETYRIWKKEGSPDPRGLGASQVLAQLGVLIDLTYFMVEATRMRESYELALVYGPDDHLLYFYVVNDPPEARFDNARLPLFSPWPQLENDECPSWSACFTSYIDELRRRAAFVGYTLLPEEERDFQRLLEIARDVDEGRITKGEGRIGVAGRAQVGGTFSLSALHEVLRTELESKRCPSWARCVTFYVDDLQRRLAWQGSSPTRDQEEGFQRSLAIARDVDEGRITQEEALTWLRSCSSYNPLPC